MCTRLTGIKNEELKIKKLDVRFLILYKNLETALVTRE